MKGASHGSFCKVLKTATLAKSYSKILSVFATIHLNIAFLPNFCWLKAFCSVVRKELYTAPFVVCFNTTTLGNSRTYASKLQRKCLSIAFLSNFGWQKVKYKILWRKSCSLLLSQSILQQLLLKCLINKFCQYLEQSVQTRHFCRTFSDGMLYAGCSTKGAVHCSFHRGV